jgi:hypothetical protein
MPDSLTPQERQLRARAAAYAAHAKHGAAMTEGARRAFNSRFLREVDPQGVLPPEERERRAALLRRSYMQRLALRSARVRRARAEAGGGTS